MWVKTDKDVLIVMYSWSVGSVHTGKIRVESFFDVLIDYSIVACDLQLILPFRNHRMFLQLKIIT